MKRPAFSLIELIVVMSILGSVLFISLPNLSRFSANLSLNGSATALVTELRQLQAKARLTHTTQRYGTTNIAFSASGFPPPGGSGTIVLRNRFGRQKKIIVASSGRIRCE
jgi:prepilin-type N-terminal cleavage/methylation domain-containing protein